MHGEVTRFMLMDERSTLLATPFDNVADQLAERGWTILRGLFSPEETDALAAEACRLWRAGQFKQAGIGRERRVRPDVRGDFIFWLDEHAPTPAQRTYWQRMTELRRELNRLLFAGLVSLEAHFAVYPPGAFYGKHVDRFASSADRAISCVLYLNRDWRPEHGGALRLYASDRAAPVDVLPEAGVCVLFRSDSIYHEVLPAARERFSVTGWFRRRSSSPLG